MGELTVAEAYLKWGEDLLGYATVLVGPDAAPDVVAAALERLLGSTGWSTADNQRGYLFRCVLNAARMHERSAKRRVAREHRAAQRAGFVPAPEPGLAVELAELSPRQRAVVYLTYWEDLPPGAVAERLGVSEGSVRRHLARARQRLRRSFDAE